MVGRAGLVGVLALGLSGSVWTLLVTRPRPARRRGPLTKGESHALRSLFAAEQLALRLAAGVAPTEAWDMVSRTNHFPPGSAMPASVVAEALALVEALRQGARRRQLRPVRAVLAAIVLPLLTCLLPASVIILLL